MDKEYYVQPYSCTGGDYWDHAEYAFVCSKCGVINRLLTISHENDRWQPHAWAPDEDGGARYRRGEKCDYKKCKSKYSPFIREFKSVIRVANRDGDYGGCAYPARTINNFD